MAVHTFSALLSRMKYILRWGLMRSSRPETLAEHTTETAQIAHLLAVVARDRFGKEVHPDRLAAVALYHDASEIITGDMPTPVKYNNQSLQSAYKALEEEAARSYMALLPEDLAGSMQPYFTAEQLSTEEKTLLKAADKLSALIKCIEEEQSGNREFAAAKEAQLHSLTEMGLPEVDFFMVSLLPAYSYTLDKLMQKK